MAARQNYDYTFKLVIIGDSYVGKSSLVERYAEKTFDESNHNPTVGVAFKYRNIEINGKNIRLKISDTAGQERYRSMASTFYKDATGVIVVYDVTSAESFDSIERQWQKEINDHAPKDVAVTILGNKCDCGPSKRAVSTETGQNLATRMGYHFMETSAKEDVNVDQAIDRMVKIMIGPTIEKNEFLKAIAESRGTLKQLNIILHGPPGVGKTSLKQIILGLPPLPEESQNSTNVLDNAVRAVTVDRAKRFEEISNEELIHLFARTILKDKNEPAAVETIVEEEIKSNKRRKWFKLSYAVWKKNTPEKPKQQPSTTKDDIKADHSAAIDMGKVKNLRLIHDQLVFAEAGESAFFDSKWHHLIDSGGQPQFQDMLPLVYRSPSFQIVVLRLTEKLDDRPKMQYTVEGKNAIEIPEDLRLTNRQYIERACQIADACDSSSKVIIVGTHKDKLGPDADSKIKDYNKELISIRKRFPNIVICKSKSEIIFDMDTMATGEERNSNIAELQEMIDGVSEKIADSQIVSLKWLSFHLEIDRSDQGVVSTSKCFESGKALGMDEDSVIEALTYFNETGLLLYYPNIPDIVLTKVDPLVNRLSALIKASILPPRLLADQCETLRKRGTFDKAFFESLFPHNTTSSCVLLDNDRFLKMLQCLKLIVPIASDKYFLPSALSYYSNEPDNRDDLCCGFTIILNDIREKRILPHGLFFTTIIELQNDTSCFNLKLRTDKEQYRDCIQLYDDKLGVLTITDKKWWIQVSMIDNGNNMQYCRLIRQNVCKSIDKAMNSLKHIKAETLPILKKVYLCPADGHDSDHYCYLSANRNRYICADDVDCQGDVTESIMCWIRNPVEAVCRQQFGTTPTGNSVFQLLKGKSANWDGIGRAFEVLHNDREILRRDMSKDADAKLESVIVKWIESQAPVSWSNVIEVLEHLEYKDIIHSLCLM